MTASRCSAPNGNGKSTFAKLLAGRLEPMDGTHDARRRG